MDDARDHLIACLPRLRRYARALVGDRTRADDLVQDTVERAWRHLASWRRDGDMRAWLFGIMHNVHVDQLRRPRLLMEELDEDWPDMQEASQADMTLDEMSRALRTLPDEQRETLLLVVLEELQYDEVAALLNVPIGTVMSRLSRARQRLKAYREGGPQVPALKVIK
ncbi:sigma-70 family RNA polymerase sigma factor [uncultured Oxalicibacterium sp.]|uniref:RNA polymerase sigma factor n=1 Tax=uncultured Oxalicibacterium sp. TaxID=1168540 RepID=UPI0025E9AB5E|nr:sigma-70 family RNA polymerase sigma factor [uncultured Oxalicibacterium sp.]